MFIIYICISINPPCWNKQDDHQYGKIDKIIDSQPNPLIIFHQQEFARMSTSCFQSCLTCSDTTFNSCLTCDTTLYALSANTCACLTPWQSECTGESSLRSIIVFLAMLVQLFLIGSAFLYLLRVRLPISYRIWSAIGGLTLLVYNNVFYLDYEDEFILKELYSATNGPYFATYRNNDLSTIYIMPTVIMAAIVAILYPLMFVLFRLVHPQPQIIQKQADKSKSQHNSWRRNRSQAEGQQPEDPNQQSLCLSFCLYLKNEGGHFFDCLIFLCSRMMFFFIGKVLSEATKKSTIFIVIAAVYGVLILVSWGRMVYKYHKEQLDETVYDGPIYLYTMLSPATFIGLPMTSSKLLMIIIYISPVALLFLILLLNRHMKIFTRSKVKVYLSEIISIALTIAFILFNAKLQTYCLLAIMGIAIILFVWEGVVLTHFLGIDLSGVKVNPQPEIQEIKKKRINRREDDDDAFGGGDKQGYF